MQNLWPEDIGKMKKINIPENILKDQASLLGGKANKLVLAEVIHDKSEYSGKTIFKFNIIAPTYDDRFRYNLFWIEHEIDLYPLVLYSQNKILGEFCDELPSNPEINLPFIKINSEEEFLETLKKIFNTKTTRKIINSILVQIANS